MEFHHKKGKFHKPKGKFHATFKITLKISIQKLEIPLKVWKRPFWSWKFLSKNMEFSIDNMDFHWNSCQFHTTQGNSTSHTGTFGVLIYLPVKKAVSRTAQAYSLAVKKVKVSCVANKLSKFQNTQRIHIFISYRLRQWQFSFRETFGEEILWICELELLYSILSVPKHSHQFF